MIIDQAKRLRELMMENQNLHEPEKIKTTMSARVISVASGKGGVGKSNFTINMAIQMRKLGKRVAIIDADFGLANVEILLGVAPRYTVADILNGSIEMEAALTVGPMGCMFLSGGSGMAALTDLTDNQILRLTDGFLQLDKLVDYILIDTRAGISNVVTNFIRASSDTIVVTTPDPTAIADAYALIKSVKTTMPEVDVLRLVVNCAVSEAEANDVFEKLSGVSARFLGIKIFYLGYIPFDSYLVRAVRKQKPVSLQYPFAKSANKYNLMCANLLNMET
ncbi:MAG: MinD/ParA family protein, partial [Defluviitaleaceae bacterium]|nr:MinD/ParA family protein [Defluviitaleaceae bacterium]